jgi:hypothetical protein
MAWEKPAMAVTWIDNNLLQTIIIIFLFSAKNIEAPGQINIVHSSIS